MKVSEFQRSFPDLSVSQMTVRGRYTLVRAPGNMQGKHFTEVVIPQMRQVIGSSHWVSEAGDEGLKARIEPPLTD